MSVLLESEPLPGIVQWTLNRPQMRNALDADLIGRLQGLLAFHAQRPETRVVLLRAAGPAFCAGVDLQSMQAQGQSGWEENLADAERLAALLSALYHFPKPIVAAVQGPAFGAGIGLVAACDIAIGAEEAKFCLSEVRLGITPAVISPYLVEAIGIRHLRRYALSGEMMSAERAGQLGLLHEIVPLAALGGEALRLAMDLAQGGPQALAECKHLLQSAALEAHGPDRDQRLASSLARKRAGEEAQAGLAAMRSRRAPPWSPG